MWGHMKLKMPPTTLYLSTWVVKFYTLDFFYKLGSLRKKVENHWHRVYVFIFTYCTTMMIKKAAKFDLFNSVSQIVKRCAIILIVVKSSLIQEPLSKLESLRANLLFDGFQLVLEVKTSSRENNFLKAVFVPAECCYKDKQTACGSGVAGCRSVV